MRAAATKGDASRFALLVDVNQPHKKKEMPKLGEKRKKKKKTQVTYLPIDEQTSKLDDDSFKLNKNDNFL